MNLPLGYRYGSVYAGIRKQANQDDLALILSDTVANAAAVFTQNMVQASPVRWARKALKSSAGRAVAILVNAGNANCATRTGDKVVADTMKSLAKVLRTKADYILPASTGVIGVELDAKRIINAYPQLIQKLSPEPAAFEAAARAIMTTDTRMKTAFTEIRLKRGTLRIAGMTKGAGMIHPNMATTLGFVMTDAIIDSKQLKLMLLRAVDRSYNCLTVDGDTSTNDTVTLMANGASGIKLGSAERVAFEAELGKVMESLARQIAADGEGARKLITVRATGFKNDDLARRIARSIASSPLVKTAVAGSDPNWGRILAAAGYSGVEFDPAKVDVYLQGVRVCRRGLAADFDEAAMKQKLDEPDIQILVAHDGRNKGEARYFTCDLTEGYIEINGSYRT